MSDKYPWLLLGDSVVYLAYQDQPPHVEIELICILWHYIYYDMLCEDNVTVLGLQNVSNSNIHCQRYLFNSCGS